MPREVTASHSINLPPHLQPQTAKERMDMTAAMTAWALENMPVARKMVMAAYPDAHELAANFGFSNYCVRRPKTLPMRGEGGSNLGDQLEDMATRMYVREWRCEFGFLLRDYSKPVHMPTLADPYTYHGRADM